MLRSFNGDNFIYEKLSQDEQTKRGILGRLLGVIADTAKPTRNGRLYSEKLWNKVFDNPIMQEKIANRCVFGELCHPLDGREEVDPEKIAICLAEIPKKNDKGQLMGVFDILNTPCGKILKTMCDYGTNIGISSRGSGDTFTNANGEEEVDDSTYDCVGFDAVFVPGVKEARLKYVTESLDTAHSLTESLSSLVESSTVEDKKVMEETLSELGINYSDNNLSEDVHIANQNNLAAEDDGATVIRDLQEALKENKTLEATIKSLQEKLSVCYAKEAEHEVNKDKLKMAVEKLSNERKTSEALRKRVSAVSEQLNNANNELAESIQRISALNESLKDSRKAEAKTRTELSEGIISKDEAIKNLKKDIASLKENLDTVKTTSDEKIKKLTEDIMESHKDYEIVKSECSKKVEKASAMAEKYKSIAKTSVNKYIDSQALRLGITSSEIKNRLMEGYTFADIDKVCDELLSYQVSISKLPFSLSKESKVKMTIEESKKTSPLLPKSNLDDEVDPSLMRLAGID